MRAACAVDQSQTGTASTSRETSRPSHKAAGAAAAANSQETRTLDWPAAAGEGRREGEEREISGRD